MGSNWYPKKTSGAKEGLEQKMAYWKDKDYQYEFGVSIGAAINIAAQAGTENLVDRAFTIFCLALEAKSDSRFIETFEDYYSNKKTSFEKAATTKSEQEELPVIKIL